MPTEAYLDAAESENRKPSVLMRVESADGKETYYGTSAEWAGSDTLTNITTAPAPSWADDSLGVAGEAWHEALKQESATTGTTGPITSWEIKPPYAGFVESATFIPTNVPLNRGFYNTRIYLQDDRVTPTATIYSEELVIDMNAGANGNINGKVSDKTIYQFSSTVPITYANWYVYMEVHNGSTWILVNSVPNGTDSNNSYMLTAAPTATLITSAIDLGSILTEPPIFSTDDVTEFGAGLTYQYTYSDDDITYSAGGAIADGGALTPSRYYKIQADFTTTNSGRGLIDDLIITEGAFRDFGTHADVPIGGVIPNLTTDSVSTLTQRIDLKKGISTTAELSVKMFWTQETSDLIATGYLKGKDVSVLSGFVQLGIVDYESVFVGTWYDHDLDEDNRIITVKVRNIMKQFEKQKLPAETFDSAGTKDTSAITYDVDNIVEVILDQYDRVGIRDRYIPLQNYTDLEAGALSGTDWNVSREVAKPTEVWKMLDELAQTAGLWLVPLGNGQILPKLWNRNEPANVALAIGNGVGDFGKVSGNLKEFYSRYYSYFNPSTGVTDPSSSDDYDSGTALINATAELRWFPEKGTKEFTDKWKVGRSVAATPLTSAPKALTDLNSRWDSWFTEPLYTTKVKKLPPSFAAIEVADVIPVNGLLLPVPEDAWDIAEPYLTGDKITFGGLVWQARQDATGEEPEEGSRYWQYTHILDTGLTDEKRFLVLAKTTNVNEAIIELDIMEMPSLTRGEVTMGGYSSIKVADGATAQTSITAPVLMTGWTTNGDSSGLTPDYTAGSITIDIDGAYRVDFQSSFSGAGGNTVEYHLWVDTTEQDEGCHRKMAASGDVGSVSCSAILDLTAGQVVTVKVEADSSSSVTPIDAQLTINQVD